MGWRERLREAVKESGLRHSEVARRAWVSPESLSRILTGRQRPSLEIVAKIAHACGERVGWILEEPGFELSGREIQKLAATRVFLAGILDKLARVETRVLPNAVPDYDEIPRHLRAEGARLVYRATDDSMRKALILSGDLLYIRPETAWKRVDGCIAVLTINGEGYVRRLRVEGDLVTLVRPEEGMPERTVSRRDPSVQLIGVVIARAGGLRTEP